MIKYLNIRGDTGWVLMAHAFNPSTLGSRGRWISEFKASLVYRVSSRTSRTPQRNPVSTKKSLRLHEMLSQRKQKVRSYVCGLGPGALEEVETEEGRCPVDQRASVLAHEAGSKKGCKEKGLAPTGA